MIIRRWSVDFKIYRAQVEDKMIMKRSKKTKYNIRFSDYGNVEMQGSAQLNHLISLHLYLYFRIIFKQALLSQF